MESLVSRTEGEGIDKEELHDDSESETDSESRSIFLLTTRIAPLREPLEEIATSELSVVTDSSVNSSSSMRLELKKSLNWLHTTFSLDDWFSLVFGV